MRAWRSVGLLWLLIATGASGADSPAPAPAPSAAAKLGGLLFADPSLSASGRQSCASCHDPANAYAAPHGAEVVMRGGPALDQPGLRTVPSLRYLADTPRFARHYYVSTLREREDRGPAGGLMRDGRADTLREQVMLPWFDPLEMANTSVAGSAARLRAAPYFPEFERAYGADALQGDAALLARAAESIERFELEDPSFHPYDSRYDLYLAGRAPLTAQERRGLRLFVDPAKGNCAECHPADPGPGGRPPAFTDYSFHALGVPRNSQIPANRDPRFFDLGLCGPRRADLADERRYCGYFKTPSLRNVARRRFLFHNGSMTTLADAVRFYAERDRRPERLYPRRDGVPRRFDDLPASLQANVGRSVAPLNWRVGRPPALSSAEIDDLVAFLRTLDDAPR
jgi:cytochrome c peroxidase